MVFHFPHLEFQMDFTFKRQRSLLCGPLPTAIFLSAAFFIGSAFIVTDYKEVNHLLIIQTLQFCSSFEWVFKIFGVLVWTFWYRGFRDGKWSKLYSAHKPNYARFAARIWANPKSSLFFILFFNIVYGTLQFHVIYSGLWFRINADLMEAKHCLKELCPQLLTLKCIHYGVLQTKG